MADTVESLRAQLDAINASTEEYKRGLLSGQHHEIQRTAVLMAVMEHEINSLRQRLAHADRSIVLIYEMAAQLTDPTALELIQDILHPEERNDR